MELRAVGCSCRCLPLRLLRPCRLQRQPHAHRQPLRKACRPLAATVGPASTPPDGDSWEPWKKKSKDDAARKALQETFKGQKDVLAAYDPGEAMTAGGGGSGGKSGGGGGFNWRPNWREWGDGFQRRASGAAQALGAVMLLLGVLAAATLREPFFNGITFAVRWVLRLEGSSTSGRRRIRGKHAPELVGINVSDRQDLGEHEKHVLSKYGADDSYFAPPQEEEADLTEQPA